MSDEQNSMIEINNLSKTYGSNKVLDDISFSVKRGEIMGFLGPNGAGKSTTMNIVTGYLSSSGGKVCIDGINIDENPMAAKRKIGYLPEIPPLYPEMTVREYLDFVYDLKGVRGKREAHLRKVMSKVHIYDVRRRMIRNLSKGYKQRVGLAQALIGDTEGPMTLAALAEKQNSGKIFVLGSLQATEMQDLMENASYCNGDFVMNTLSYLTDKGDALNIRAKVISAEALSMSEKQVKVTTVLVQYILPLLILAAGLIVWLKRRYR